MAKDLRQEINKLLFEMSAEEVRTNILPIMDKMSDYGVGKLMDEVPGLFFLMMDKMEEIGVWGLGSRAAEIVDKFMNLLWKGISIAAERSEDSKALLKNIGELTVNLEATDIPLKTHFKVSQGNFSAGPGLIGLKEQDVRLMASTRKLFDLLRGNVDIVTSVLTEQLFLEGPLGFLQKKVVPVMALIGGLIA